MTTITNNVQTTPPDTVRVITWWDYSGPQVFLAPSQEIKTAEPNRPPQGEHHALLRNRFFSRLLGEPGN